MTISRRWSIVQVFGNAIEAIAWFERNSRKYPYLGLAVTPLENLWKYPLEEGETDKWKNRLGA
ncbi:MAG: hypothetical protein KGJ90_06195 [Patescibacteria group bacterium]|nr:hypothetical protein [Patescibacteria group bacterium]